MSSAPTSEPITSNPNAPADIANSDARSPVPNGIRIPPSMSPRRSFSNNGMRTASPIRRLGYSVDGKRVVRVDAERVLDEPDVGAELERTEIGEVPRERLHAERARADVARDASRELLDGREREREPDAEREVDPVERAAGARERTPFEKERQLGVHPDLIAAPPAALEIDGRVASAASDADEPDDEGLGPFDGRAFVFPFGALLVDADDLVRVLRELLLARGSSPVVELTGRAIERGADHACEPLPIRPGARQPRRGVREVLALGVLDLDRDAHRLPPAVHGPDDDEGHVAVGRDRDAALRRPEVRVETPRRLANVRDRDQRHLVPHGLGDDVSPPGRPAAVEEERRRPLRLGLADDPRPEERDDQQGPDRDPPHVAGRILEADLNVGRPSPSCYTSRDPMRRPAAAALTVLAFSLPGPLFAQDTPETVAARVGDRVEAGPASGEGVRAGRATVVIDASFDDVIAAVTDYASYAEFMPHFRQSRVLSSRGESALVYMQAAAFHDTVVLWANLRIRPRRSIGTTRVYEGRMVEGNLHQFTARWEISPLEDGHKALVVFELLIDPDLPFPSGIITDENVHNAERVLAALRARLTAH